LTSEGEYPPPAIAAAFKEAAAASGERPTAPAIRKRFRRTAELDRLQHSADRELEHLPPLAGSGSPRDDSRASIDATAAALERACVQAACRWNQEYPDEKWSADVLRTLQNVVKPARIVDVSCHQTLCRVHVEFRDAPEAESYASTVGSDDVAVRFGVDETWASVDAYLRRLPEQGER